MIEFQKDIRLEFLNEEICIIPFGKQRLVNLSNKNYMNLFTKFW